MSKSSRTAPKFRVAIWYDAFHAYSVASRMAHTYIFTVVRDLEASLSQRHLLAITIPSRLLLSTSMSLSLLWVLLGLASVCGREHAIC